MPRNIDQVRDVSPPLVKVNLSAIPEKTRFHFFETPMCLFHRRGWIEQGSRC